MINLVDKWKKFIADQSGAVVIVTAAGLVAVLGVAALAVDLGHLYMVKGELHRASDAGALAGSHALFFPKDSQPPQCAAAITRGTAVTTANLVDGAAPTVTDIQTGFWNFTDNTFTANCSNNKDTFTNAVKVTANKDNISLIFGKALEWGPFDDLKVASRSGTGPPLLLAGIFGLGAVTLNATSIASKGWAQGINPDYAFPLTIGKNYLGPNPLEIFLNDDKSDHGGWYDKGQNPSNSQIRDYINHTVTIPQVNLNDVININNGVWHDVLTIIKNNYIGKIALLPVVNTIKYNQTDAVVGFVAFKFTDVDLHGKKSVTGQVLEDYEVPPDMIIPGNPPQPGGLMTASMLVK